MKISMKRNNNLSIGIIKTLSFFSIFSKALTAEEIREYLYETNKFTSKQIDNELQKLNATNIIDTSLINSTPQYHLKYEKVFSNFSDKLLKKAERYSYIFKHCPFIKIAFICNTVAMNCAKVDSDIDLLIVCKKNRMFTSRIFVTIITQLLGIRRHSNKISGRLCLSFFIDESEISMQKLAIKDDVYLHFWTKTLKPIYSENNKTLQKFVKTNENLIKKYFAYSKIETIKSQGNSLIKTTLESILSGHIGDLIECKLSDFQIKRANSKAKNLSNNSGTIITKTILKFHNEDKREYFKTEFGKRSQAAIKLLISSSEIHN